LNIVWAKWASVVRKKHHFKRLRDILYANANHLYVCFCLIMHLSTNEFTVFEFSSKFDLYLLVLAVGLASGADIMPVKQNTGP